MMGTCTKQNQCSRHFLPAVLMRSGTSKGLFLHRSSLPQSTAQWSSILVGAMGSQDGDLRQVDGVGGGSSTTSKVIVVAKSERPNIDVEYTFVQVAVGKPSIDMTGNCGNMSAGVAGFALDERLVQAEPGATELAVRIFNTNTQMTIVVNIQVTPNGYFEEEGTYQISGIHSKGSPIKMTFENPAGSMTGALFPTGNRQDIIQVSRDSSTIDTAFSVRASLVDAGNPFVFVDAASLPREYHCMDPDSITAHNIIESIRREAAVIFGLAKTAEQAALVCGTPKIALLFPAKSSNQSASLPSTLAIEPDIHVMAYSMGRVHPSLQLTGAVCLGTALSMEGTTAAEIARRPDGIWTPPGTPPAAEEAENLVKSVEESLVKKSWLIRHRSGIMDVDIEVERGINHETLIKRATVFRTARRLFQGTVLVKV